MSSLKKVVINEVVHSQMENLTNHANLSIQDIQSTIHSPGQQAFNKCQFLSLPLVFAVSHHSTFQHIFYLDMMYYNATNFFGSPCYISTASLQYIPSSPTGLQQPWNCFLASKFISYSIHFLHCFSHSPLVFLKYTSGPVTFLIKFLHGFPRPSALSHIKLFMIDFW